MPFLPGHFCPKGMTTRELEPDNPRPTTDGTGPNCKPGGAPALLDTEGRPVYSPNWRARGAAALHGRGDPEGSILSEEEDCTSFSEPQPVGESGLHQRPSRAQEPIELPKGWEARTSARWPAEWWKGYATWAWYQSGTTPELKPTLRGWAKDNALHQRPAACLRLPIFQFVKDWKNAFMHVRIRPEAWPTSMTLAYSKPHLRPDAPSHILYVQST